MNLTKIVKALADENRLRILNLLAQKELCVCEIESLLEITQSNASRHLTKLRDAELIECEKQGQFVFYQLNPKVMLGFPFVESLLRCELVKIKRYQDDSEKLKALVVKGMLCERGSCCNK